MDQFKSPHSSNIAGARYDAATKTLEIDFKRGSSLEPNTYVYPGVPAKVWGQFKSAISKGTFFATHIIKDRTKPRFVGVKKEALEIKAHEASLVKRGAINAPKTI